MNPPQEIYRTVAFDFARNIMKAADGMPFDKIVIGMAIAIAEIANSQQGVGLKNLLDGLVEAVYKIQADIDRQTKEQVACPKDSLN